MKIQEVINEIREQQVGVISIIAKEAYKYSSARTEEWNGSLFTKTMIDYESGDEVIQTGKFQTNITKFEKALNFLVGKGVVEIRLANRHWIECELES